jgi:phosphatidylserine decarboxylase
MTASAFVLLQYLLPKHWLTAIIYRIARIRNESLKNFLIAKFVKLYDVDVAEVKLNVPQQFATFNDFFVRELKDGARDIDGKPDSIVAPADGTLSLAGSLDENSLLQAKGINYSLQELLATDLAECDSYINGRFATIYLAPYNYHRVHAPFDAELLAARYIPGDLFSVNDSTAARVRGLFRRNERLVMHFRTTHGPAVLILVGALNVGSITTPWSGEIRPRKTGTVDAIDLSNSDTRVSKGDLLGWFNMGSTVILLLPDGMGEWRSNFDPGTRLRMGESIGTFPTGAT